MKNILNHDKILYGDNMEKTKYYYKELPTDYKEDYIIDAKSIKFTIIANIFNLIIAAIVIVICLAFIGFNISFNIDEILIPMLILAFSFIIYIFLHELTHGIFYKIFTREKLTFGFTLTVAYCGIPTIYVKKKAMIVIILAPFVIYSIASIIALLFITNPIYYLLVSILFGLHFGGCIGDLYGFFIMISKYHKKDLLINDTGPKQTFYIKEANNN